MGEIRQPYGCLALLSFVEQIVIKFRVIPTFLEIKVQENKLIFTGALYIFTI